MIGRKNKNQKKEKIGLIQILKNLILRIIYKFYNSKLGIKIRSFLEWIYRRIEKSIRFELMVVFAICFLASFLFYGFANNMLVKDRTITRIEYDSAQIQSNAYSIAQNLSGGYGYEVNGLEDEIAINEILNNYNDGKAKIYLTDLDGNILYKVNGDAKDKLDIYNILDRSNNIQDEGAERVVIYPVKIGGDRAYLIYYQTPTPYLSYEYYTDTNSFLALVLSVIIFISIFIIVTNKKMKYIEEIASGVRIISSGDLSYRVEEKGKDEIKNLAENINNMAAEIENRIEAERRSEKTKSELITNVSHDLRTPLTSVMGYIGLIKDGKYENEVVMKEYLNIAFNKSNQLKELIEDLFEYTKLNNRGVLLEQNKINIVEFLSQIIEEYIPIFEENNIEIVKKFVDEKSIVDIDAGKMVRVFENLFSNAIKYSFKPGKVIVSTYESGGYVSISIKNKGESIPKEKIDRLFDRFYRLDEARNSNTKGSGLGLAISKNIIELHKGKIWAECVGNDISFFIKLKCIN
ncbi:HAMP domain-containing protein [Clostridium sp. Sa3CUN1]|uniref:histidine kinase n=1 Tax=Clostridium gallinarum TaxID=2762246 RepID=A0ABR8Q661_9CLOT|nr:ATP-binding protein [Clostridium gallinarum]MBD7915908.1 HAMP domain-containing protein [Clostridium gallinarum]